MKKIILAGVFILTLTAIFIFRINSEANSPSQSTKFSIDQNACITDTQAKATDGVKHIENEASFVPGGHSTATTFIPEYKTVRNPAAVAVPVQNDLNPASGGTNFRTKKQMKHRGGLASLQKSEQTAQASSSELKKNQTAQPALKQEAPSQEVPSQEIPSQEELPVVGSYENLKSLLENASTSAFYMGGGPFIALPMDIMRVSVLGSMDISAVQGAGTAAADTKTDYSTTNLQVEGVDEADIVKTDGSYIYQVNRERVVIAKAFPPEDMKITCTLNYADKGFSPREMYVDENHLIVIGGSNGYSNYPQKRIGVSMMMPYYYCQRQMMKALIYDIKDKSDIKQIRELELNGAYVSSRKVGQSLYLIAKKNLYFWNGMEIDEPKPLYRDSAAGDGFTEVDYQNIRYFPDFIESSYLIFAGLNLDRPKEAASVSSYLGSGQNIYASTRNLYVTVTSYRQNSIMPISKINVLPDSDITKTKIYKFGMNEGTLNYEARGKAPGTILNQFSMDEYGDYFRIATTQGDIWGSGQNASRNNVYIFDGCLNIIGKIEGIAQGEKIYSVRFMGERGYMVTYKTVDPLFVLDFKDPCNPAILGELKIPGYSDYLHPYDENHVIGFGKDSVEMGNTAYYLGMKMAIFDVSNVRTPVEMFSEKIGDRGTDSELLRNHKALLFSKERNLLAFPVRIMEVKENTSRPANILEYGSFSFQGAYVYNIDLVNGFVPKGEITHLTKEDYLNSNNYWYDTGKYIERIIYIDDTLYTLSKGMIKANAIDGLQEVNSLDIK